VAPATAHLLARAAQGLADDLLTTILLAAQAPVVAAPAMNDRMYAHPATQRNLQVLTERGWTLIGPVVGALAEGPSELPGRMVEPDEILAHVERAVGRLRSRLAGKRVVVTAGPTREALDPVRVISNRSSGRMGYAVAERAFARGADVVLIAGPSDLPPPVGIDVVRVDATADLERAVGAALPDADVLVMAAAPADYRPGEPAAAKRPRGDGTVQLTLEPTADVLHQTRDRRKAGAVIVGFALETDDGIERAREKLRRKELDLVVLNYAGDPDGGFERDTNRVTFVGSDTTQQLDVLPKRIVAERLLDAVEERL
jgi:phosphopantothenoylcysteine decarboxylase/phosphopantothenate--cysteine ligase